VRKTKVRKEEKEVSTFFGQNTQERDKNPKKRKKKEKKKAERDLSLRFIHSFFCVCVFFFAS